jgi:hypothetical protein
MRGMDAEGAYGKGSLFEGLANHGLYWFAGLWLLIGPGNVTRPSGCVKPRCVRCIGLLQALDTWLCRLCGCFILLSGGVLCKNGYRVLNHYILVQRCLPS